MHLSEQAQNLKISVSIQIPTGHLLWRGLLFYSLVCMYRCLCVCRLEVDSRYLLLHHFTASFLELHFSGHTVFWLDLWSCFSLSPLLHTLPPHDAGIMSIHLDSDMFARYLNSGPHAWVESTLLAEPSVKSQRRLLIIKKAKVDIHQSLSLAFTVLVQWGYEHTEYGSKEREDEMGLKLHLSIFLEVGTILSS